MPPTVRLSPAAEVPAGARVRHYDELPEPGKERLPAVVGPTAVTTSDPAIARIADRCDLVKFTDYYRIERCGPDEPP